jgi:hypothetical protein
MEVIMNKLRLFLPLTIFVLLQCFSTRTADTNGSANSVSDQIATFEKQRLLGQQTLVEARQAHQAELAQQCQALLEQRQATELSAKLERESQATKLAQQCQVAQTPVQQVNKASFLENYFSWVKNHIKVIAVTEFLIVCMAYVAIKRK